MTIEFMGDTDCKPLLSDLRILEIGHYVAAPFCTRLLGDLGADVIKIEPFAGDPVRAWGAQKDGRSLWWSMHGRNKRSVAMDLKSRDAARLILELASKCDAVVENFRPGHLEKLGLGAAAMRAVNPKLVIAHISGHGQDGPYRDRAAFGLIGEAMGGLRYLTNHAPGVTDLPPVRVGVSIGDSIAGLYAAFGLMAALWQRDRKGGDGRARSLDVALTDSVLSMMEGMLPEFGALGKIRRPSGGAIATAAPSNAYRTADDLWVLIAANSGPLFAKLAALMKRPELVDTPEFRDNPSRVKNAAALDRVIEDWSRSFSADELLAMLNEFDVPACKVYDASDCAGDPQFRHRHMVREIEDPLLGSVLQAGIVPLVPESPGTVRWAGPDIGQHTDQVLSELLGLDAAALRQLRLNGVVR
jgi:crotonobetainyl-CoA:carnitine CoA-transferase CaiB-like acyl-CoA transferase